MWIGGTPSIKIVRGSFNSEQPLPFPFGSNCLLFFSARYALFHGLSALGLKAGDRLLVPAYCCGTEVDSILAQGIKIQWYNVDENLRIDIKYLQNQWQEGIKGLLIIHYMGFDQLTKEILDFCHERKIFLIEDCAHAFLSLTECGEPLGAKGEVAVFSLRKSMPIPDGGALFLKSIDAKTFQPKLKQPDLFAVFFRTCELLAGNSTLSDSFKDRFASCMSKYVGKALNSFKLFFRILHKLFGVCETCLVHPNSYDFVSKATYWSISSFSKRRLQFQDWKSIAIKRRSNFTYLLEKIQGIDGIKPLISSLPAGACPLFFPVLVEDREKLHNFLLKYGIDSHPWWGYFHPEIPWNSFPPAIKLKKELLGLPINQDLNHNHMERIVSVLRLATGIILEG